MCAARENDLSKILTPAEGGVYLDCRVQPKASSNRVDSIYGESRLKIAVTSPALEGKANKALLKFLSKKLKVPASAVHLVSGEKSRNKRIHVGNTNVADLTKRIQDAM